MQNLSSIRILISEGNLKEALDALLKQLESTDRRTRKLRDGVIILHSKFQDLTRKETLGLIETDDVLREKSLINEGLLNIIGDVESGIMTPEPIPARIVDKWRWWWWLIPVAVVAVVWDDIRDWLNPKPAALIIEKWAWRPDPVVLGQETTVIFDIFNNGPGEARNFTVLWYATSTSSIPSKQWTVNQLPAGQRKSFEFPYRWPTNTSVPLKFKVFIEVDQNVSNPNRANNEKLIEVTIQDIDSTVNVVSDMRDGKVYKTIQSGGKTWLAENLNFSMENSWCYQGIAQNCSQYGRLYTWDAANLACRNFGAGWRLPTKDEWEAFRTQYGGGRNAYTALIKGGNSKFGALLSGKRVNNGFQNQGQYGYYWTSSRGCLTEPCDRAFSFSFDGRNRDSAPSNMPKEIGVSCRCIKD